MLNPRETKTETETEKPKSKPEQAWDLLNVATAYDVKARYLAATLYTALFGDQVTSLSGAGFAFLGWSAGSRVRRGSGGEPVSSPLASSSFSLSSLEVSVGKVWEPRLQR